MVENCFKMYMWAFKWAVLGLVWATATSANADTTLFSDFGSTYTYNQYGGYGIGLNPVDSSLDTQAMQFTAADTGAVTTLYLALNWESGTNSVIVNLTGDDAGRPGAILESFSLVNQLALFSPPSSPLAPPSSSPNPPPVVISSSLNPVLSAGSSYWLSVAPGASDTQAVWNFNDQGVSGTDAISFDGGVTWPVVNVQQPFAIAAFSVLASPVPEADSYPMMLVGLGLLGFVIRRKGR